METTETIETSTPGSQGKTKMTTMTTSGDQAIFRLEEQTAEWNGFKLWTLTFDLPGEKVNKLSRKVMETFNGTLRELENLANQDRIEALVLLSGKSGNFIAGADIEMLQAAKSAAEAEELSRMGQKLMERWEDLPFPTVAAINGTALGGGLEFALSCSAIVMSNDPAAKIGLPEVNLGLIPGMGGCVRLPRKAGLATALDMILTGKTLSGDRALRAGVIEACLPKENFTKSALFWVKNNYSALKSGKRLAMEPKLGGMGGPIGAMMEKTPMGRSVIFKKARAGVIEKTKNKYPAPLEALDVIQSTGGAYGPKIRGKARDAAMIREAQGFGKVAATDVSRNLIRLFFLTEGVKKSKGLPAGISAEPKAIKSGAGCRGHGRGHRPALCGQGDPDPDEGSEHQRTDPGSSGGI